MTPAVTIFSMILVTLGGFFFLAGTLGLLRFPDPLSRLHALTKADTLGLGLIVLGLLPQMNDAVSIFKLILIWILILIASGTATQLIGKRVREESHDA